MHRDLAARNVMLFSTNPPVAKVSDFGLSQFVQGSHVSTTSDGVVPLRWVPAEVITRGQWSTASDVYAFGVLLWELWTMGATPWGLGGDNGVKENILEGRILHRIEG